jgi:hypothetical protein
LTRQGLVFTVARDDAAFRITLTGGF